MALFVSQLFLGGLTAHYTIEGQCFYGLDLSWLPYSLSRTWHIQSAIFWIATAFLAAGLFLAPLINGGKDPKYQALRSEEHTSELQFLMRISYAVFCWNKTNTETRHTYNTINT